MNEGNINTTITCAGVKVAPGDLVVGDADGVCVIPREYINIVLEEAEKKLAYKLKRRVVIEQYRKAKQDGSPRPVLAPSWVLDMLSK